jgi:glycosyltransferase involved in cell wall biosynthesis
MKNLDLAIDLVSKVDGATLDIYGPIGQQHYWNGCLKQIESSSRPTAFRYCGSVVPKDVLQTFSQYDLLLHPSQNESFGYVILEALAAGCPVLISDRTPWRDIFQARVGMEVSLSNPFGFHEALLHMRDLAEPEHAKMRERARVFANKYVATTPAKASTRRIYLSTLKAAGHSIE